MKTVSALRDPSLNSYLPSKSFSKTISHCYLPSACRLSLLLSSSLFFLTTLFSFLPSRECCQSAFRRIWRRGPRYLFWECTHFFWGIQVPCREVTLRCTCWIWLLSWLWWRIRSQLLWETGFRWWECWRVWGLCGWYFSVRTECTRWWFLAWTGCFGTRWVLFWWFCWDPMSKVLWWCRCCFW